MPAAELTHRQAEARHAALMLGTTSPTAVAKALDVRPPTAHGLLRRANAGEALEEQRERQRDKTGGLIVAVSVLSERLARCCQLMEESGDPDHVLRAAAGLDKVLDGLRKIQEMGIFNAGERTASEIELKAQRRAYHAMRNGARLALRYGSSALDRINARLAKVQGKT